MPAEASSGVLYDSFVAELYDHLPIVTGRRDVDFYLHYARAERAPVLELGCGTGRILLAIAATGCRAVGLDISERMLAQCRKKLAAAPAQAQPLVRLVHGDMTDFELGEIFRLIIIPFRPFQHLLKVEQQLACLHCASQHLAPDGKLIMDFFQTDARHMHDPAFLEESSPSPEARLPDGRTVRMAERIRAFHRAEQCNDVELVYYVTHADGRSERLVFPFTVRYFFRYEVEHLLARCGFRVAEVFGDFDRSPLGDTSPEMIFAAEKAAR